MFDLLSKRIPETSEKSVKDAIKINSFLSYDFLLFEFFVSFLVAEFSCLLVSCKKIPAQLLAANR